MKQKILLTIITIVLFGCLSTAPLQETPQVVRVIEIEESKDALFRLSNEWLVEVFNAADEVIEYSDKAEGVLMGKGYLVHHAPLGAWNVWHTIKIEAKENRARISIYDLYFTVSTGSSTSRMEFETQGQWDEVKADIIALADDYEAHLKAGLDASW